MHVSFCLNEFISLFLQNNSKLKSFWKVFFSAPIKLLEIVLEFKAKWSLEK